jgi:glycine betaine/proline transport system substrate-binding protein
MSTFCHKVPLLLITCYLFSAFFTASYPQSNAGLSTKPQKIIIIQNDWTSQIVLAHILQAIYKKMQIPTQLKTLTTEEQWGQLSRGWVHIQVEVWQGTMEKMLKRLVKTGQVIEAGTHQAHTREDWWYPLYVKKLCPGLPHWKALKKCAHLFKTNPTDKRGRYLGGPWEKPEKARIRALDLPYRIERVKHSDELWRELETHVRQKRPILLFNWTPNWVEAKYPGEFVDFPDYDPLCETDAKWGHSSRWKYDCGNPKSGWLKKTGLGTTEKTFSLCLGNPRQL